MTATLTAGLANFEGRAVQSEKGFVSILMRRIRADWPSRAMATEVRSHGRCRTDVCVRVRDMHSPRGQDVVVGIEAKLDDWSRAITQAALNRYTVDASMIAMPAQRISGQIIVAAVAHGVGVLGVEPRNLSVMVPAVLGTPDPALFQRVIAQLEPTRARGRSLVSDLIAEGR